MNMCVIPFSAKMHSAFHLQLDVAKMTEFQLIHGRALSGYQRCKVFGLLGPN